MNATSKKISEIIFKWFVGAIFAINVALTFVFGGEYGAETLPTPVPVVSYILGGLMLATFYDFAAFGWFIARTRDHISTTQRAIASLLAGLSMLFSVIVSALHLLMTTTLVDLSDAYRGIGILGTGMLITAASLHFLGLFAYRYFDPVQQDLEAESETKARLQAFRIEQQDRVTDKMFNRVQQIMDGQVDEIAEGEAAAMWANLVTQIKKNPLRLNTPNIIDGGVQVFNSESDETPIKRDSNAGDKRPNGPSEKKDNPFRGG